MYRLPTKVTAFAIALSFQWCGAQTPAKQNPKATEGVAQFVQAVYNRYGPNGDPPSLFEENAGLVFHSSLIALAREDQRAVGPGDAGVIDYDPVCNCQDPDIKFDHLKLQVEVGKEDSCKVAVNFDGQNGAQTPIVLVLEKENEQWRIYDIENHGRGGRPSLRAALEKEIQSLSARGDSK